MKTLNDTINGVMESGPARRGALMDWVLARLIHDEISGVLVELAAFLQDGGLTAEQLGKLDTIGAQLHEVKSFTTKLIITASRSEAAITSARAGDNKRGKFSKEVTKGSFIKALTAIEFQQRVRGATTTCGWKKLAGDDLGCTYRKGIAPRLAEWGMSEASVVRFLKTGKW